MDITDQPGLLRLAGVNTLAAQHHSAGQRLAYAADQPLGAARARHNAEGNFRQAKTGVVAGDNQVTQQGQLAAGAKRVAVDRSDERFSESINSRPQPWANIIQGGRQIFLRHLIEVGPGGKKTRVAADNADADAVINCRNLQRLGNLG